jgi:anti-sigma-K factor RskA
MTISDETLMAYADGELDAAARAAVESAMQDDPQIEKRVAQHRALRLRVQAAYSTELSEALPERLLKAARPDPSQKGGNIVNLQEARAAMERSAPRAAPRWPSRQSAGALAASLVVGVAVGFFMWGRSQSPLVLGPGGALVARGPLAQALSNQLASEQSPSSAVRVEVSFLAKSGEYCRTFSLSGEASPSGIACRQGDEWQVQTLAGGPAAAGDSEYRTAGSGLPAPILKSVEGQIAGDPLDQAGEKAARARGWKSIAR